MQKHKLTNAQGLPAIGARSHSVVEKKEDTMRTIEDFIYTGNVKIIALPQREISDESVYSEVVGKTGKVVRISGEKVGVLIDGKENPYSRYGCFWFNPECLEFVDKKNNSIEIPEEKENNHDC